MRRPRGPGGRFLTAEEIAAQKLQQEAETAGPSGSASIDGDGEDDDDAMGEYTKDIDMAVDSPVEPSKPPTQVQIQSQQLDKQREIRPPPALASGQPLLQPRPQPVGPTFQPQLQPPPQAQQQASMVPQQQPTPQPKPLPSPIPQAPPPMQSPPPPTQPTYNLQLGGHSTTPVSLMNIGYPHPMSHPATPAPVSPNPTPDALNPLEHVPPEAYSRPQPGSHPHDHSRNMTTAGGDPRPRPGAHTHSHPGQPGKAAHMPPSHPTQTAGPSNAAPSSIALRAPYHAAMQMHHVPHPHARARHHASFINRADRLYTTGPEHNVLNISAEGIKGDMQRRGGDIMRFAAPSHSSNSK